MAIADPTSATLAGARDLNRVHRTAAQEDLGAKLEQLISAHNTSTEQVSVITVALAQMIACAASFASALSTADLTSAAGSNTSGGAVIVNFRAD